eukprot:11164530-Karenia_brevis.AAC.1
MSEASLPASSIIGDERVENNFSYESLDIPQYPTNMVAEPNTVELEEKMMNVVAITVKQVMGE